MKLLSILILPLSMVASSQVFAVNIQPTENNPVCLQRVYSEEHMANNPLQKISEMTVKVIQKSFVDEYSADKKVHKYHAAQVVGRSTQDNLLYGNTATCEFAKDGSAKCFIECDGGSFSLQQRPSWINFSVSPNYYFPLFKGVLEADIENTPDSISLEAKDKNNNLFRLEKVPVEKCDQVISEVTEVDGGC